MSPARGDRPDVAADLRRRAAACQGDPRRSRRRQHAAVARRSEAREVRQRPEPVCQRSRDAAAMGQQRRAARRPQGPSRAAAVRRRLDDRRTGSRPDDSRVQGPGRGVRRVPSTSSSRPTFPRTGGSRRSRSGPATARSCITSSSARAPRNRSGGRPDSTFAEGMDVPAGQTGGPPEEGGPEAGARRQPLSSTPAHGRLDRRLRSRLVDDGLRAWNGHAPAQRIDDRPADALHDQRQGSPGPHEARALLRQAGAGRGSPVRQPLERQFYDSRRRPGPRRHCRDGDDRGCHPAADAAAHAPAREELGVHRDLSRRALGSRSWPCRSTTSTGRPTTSSRRR